MVLSDVEETVTIVEVEEDNVDPAVRVSSPFVPLENTISVCLFPIAFSEGLLLIDETVKKRSDMLFVRGDSVIMLSPGGGDKR
jgi:small nuclear ribonucleoprotein (snRNP)-like protein